MEEDAVWQDREIRFDLPIALLDPRRGEIEIDSINSVEDTKGNNGIGYSCVSSMSIKSASSRLRGTTQALFVMTKYNNSRFEFIFTSLVKQSPRLFTTVQAVFRAYETSKMYRDLKLRGSIIKEKELVLLPHEQVYSKTSGVWNLSSDQGNLGSFFITNVRVVWYATLAENFNVSIPYLQMKSVRIRDSKFGPALVIETSSRSGGYILGFRIDPVEALQDVFKEISSLHTVFSANPIFGIDFTVEDPPEEAAKKPVARKEDDVEILSTEEDSTDLVAAYFADPSKDRDRDVVFDETLGLAVESLREGWTMEKLWSTM